MKGGHFDLLHAVVAIIIIMQLYGTNPDKSYDIMTFLHKPHPT